MLIYIFIFLFILFSTSYSHNINITSLNYINNEELQLDSLRLILNTLDNELLQFKQNIVEDIPDINELIVYLIDEEVESINADSRLKHKYVEALLQKTTQLTNQLKFN